MKSRKHTFANMTYASGTRELNQWPLLSARQHSIKNLATPKRKHLSYTQKTRGDSFKTFLNLNDSIHRLCRGFLFAFPGSFCEAFIRHSMSLNMDRPAKISGLSLLTFLRSALVRYVVFTLNTTNRRLVAPFSGPTILLKSYLCYLQLDKHTRVYFTGSW